MLTKILLLIGVVLFFSIIFIFVRKDRFRGGGSLGNALQEFHSLLEPGVKNTIIERKMDHTQEDEYGEPPIKDEEKS